MVRLSKLIPDGIENGFSLFGKAAQDQHRFRCDCVDHITDLPVVKDEIDELSNLDIIDSDTSFAVRGYDQVLLVCPIVYLDVPDRDAIDPASSERRVEKISPN